MAIVLGVAVSQLFQTQEFIQKLSESQQKMLNFRKARTYLLDAETAQRGFLLTSKEVYLSPWTRSEAEFPAHMQKLGESLGPANPQAQRFQELLSVSTSKMEELRATIALRREQGMAPVLPLVNEDVGLYLMDRARALVDEALVEEATVQANMQDRQVRGVWVTTFLIIASALLCLAAGVNAFSLFQKALKATRLQRRALIQRRRAMNSDREKNLFMANMSHEIRTPMNAIIGFTQLLREEVESPRARHYVNAIATAGDSLLSLINDVLDLSKIEAGRVDLKPEVIDLREVVNSLQLMLSERASAKGLTFLTEVDEAVPAWLLLDPLRLRQMLMNLLGNAIKFTNDGHISLAARAEILPGTTETVSLILTVSDTGRGIAAEDLEAIFRPFRQGPQQGLEIVEGTGLGLSITRRLVHLMGGKITAVSGLEKGSTFTILLPSVPVADTGPSPGENEADAIGLEALPRMKILIADDNAYNREVMGGFFKNTHHEVSFATNGLEAVEQAVQLTPDLILMDIRMPRLDGRQATELLRHHENLARVPIIAVTASSLTHTKNNARAAFDGYLRKPFRRPELVHVIRQALNATEPTAPSTTASTVGEVSAPLPAAAAAELRMLLAERWPILTRTMAVRAVRSFADELDTIASAHFCPSLRDYTATLKHEVATFQISRFEKSLAEFPTLVETLAPLSPSSPS